MNAQHLPHEIWHTILSFLTISIQDLLACMRVSKQFYALAQDDYLWRNRIPTQVSHSRSPSEIYDLLQYVLDSEVFKMAMKKHKAGSAPSDILTLSQVLRLLHAWKRRNPSTFVLPSWRITALFARLLASERNPLRIERLRPQAVVEQLTLIDSRLYGLVTRQELHPTYWNRSKHVRHSSSVMHLIMQFNYLGRFVSYDILKYAEIDQRVVRFCYWHTSFQHLHKIHNFHCAMAVFAALHNASIHRLKRTSCAFQKKHKKIFQQSEFFSRYYANTRNWADYRELLLSLGEHEPRVPYLGVILTDIQFLCDGHRDTTQQIAQVLDSVEAMQKEQYTAIADYTDLLARVLPLVDMSMHKDNTPEAVYGSLPDDEELWRISRTCEPPGS